MYKKTLRRDDWSRIIKKDLVIDDISFDGMDGKASLLVMKEIKDVMIINNTVDDLKIVDVGYSWLQIALKDEYYWITAIYDEKGNLLSIYIDMSDGNVIEDDDAYFYDIYLDYEIYKGRILTLDKDELLEAYENKDITFEQYNRTLLQGEKLHDYLLKHHEELVDFCGKTRDELLKKI